jgi:hypothetical protein
MTSQSNFAPEEWKTILEAGMMAGIAVTAADPSGLWGLLRESMAGTAALLDTSRADVQSALLKAIGAELEEAGSRQAVQDEIAERLWGKTPAEVTSQALETLRRAAGLVEARAPGEAPAFKAWLHGISAKVAEAATEGGFLGFGGVRVSEAEKATLAQISAALGLPA